LWEESKGQVKYQKKWTPILKAMQSKFGNHFTKKQCQSKYWSVRRECTEYRIMSMKAAATDPMWNPSIAGRELLKPKFYDVWLDVSGKNLAIVTNSTGKGKVGGSGEPLIDSSRALREDGQSVKARSKDSNRAMVEMQRLMLVEIQASEKREEAMKYRAELMMELLTQHIEHVENRVNSIDEGRNPQLQLLERVNLKLEKVLDGFAVLNQNLSMLH
jgi:hypothetical protein